MSSIQTVFITGANAGLGFESARQLAEQKGIKKIYLGCRNLAKAETAKSKLVARTGKDIFEIVIIDVSDSQSVRNAVKNLNAPIDAVILNAGGSGGKTPNSLTKDGVTTIFAANVLGHTIFVDELLKRQMITSTVLYAGSETARGVPKMGVAKPDLVNYSKDEFTSVANGSRFAANADLMTVYGTIKLTATLWMSSMARQYPHIRFVTMSPGGTTGTNGADDLPFAKKLFFKYIGGLFMPILGMMHSVEKGAKRYVDGLFDPRFESGSFYASRQGAPTGPVVDQVFIEPAFGDKQAQDNARFAIEQFS
ncbi:SDR family NAD(P)-dependent oxidoreductase [Vibrio sp. SCSIO 43137]|uniref:SDR family NAD(P)-dependent oxidoreductase n=1 Tax=Vibrio sp. SCSIO 43137 TaxID=3021011 RepID=UPI002308150F|nr:SDR family NAD(P)-dependent oxidoreductase [Vibrio sp. SCSIO 43137]WCE30758.1 SDR family NAD(P)-dependent oxidoreductase [Vibrio sp. SCSIO 43137]